MAAALCGGQSESDPKMMSMRVHGAVLSFFTLASALAPFHLTM
jgi:hypothetical protein